tara:strand:+ start:997 stop:1203 length:207 start_codon:yes stop_codon:yes gene_type:complete
MIKLSLINMLVSECCEWPPTFEPHEQDGEILGFCSKCGEGSAFIDDDDFDKDDEAKTIGVENGKSKKS